MPKPNDKLCLMKLGVAAHEMADACEVIFKREFNRVLLQDERNILVFRLTNLFYECKGQDANDPESLPSTEHEWDLI